MLYHFDALRQFSINAREEEYSFFCLKTTHAQYFLLLFVSLNPKRIRTKIVRQKQSARAREREKRLENKAASRHFFSLTNERCDAFGKSLTSSIYTHTLSLLLSL